MASNVERKLERLEKKLKNLESDIKEVANKVKHLQVYVVNKQKSFLNTNYIIFSVLIAFIVSGLIYLLNTLIIGS